MPETHFPPARVYLVDDEPSIRRAFTRLLRSAGYETISYESAEEFLSDAEAHDASCCLIVDLRMPGLSGLDLQADLERCGLPMSVVFISGHADVQSGIRAMKAGAVDFLQKPVSQEVLLDAVDRALERDRLRRLAGEHRSRLLDRLARLTPRERDVFGLVVTGLMNKQVGAELGTTEKTVKVHRARVMQKMEAASLAELVRMADCIGPLGHDESAGLSPPRHSRGTLQPAP
jgi:FixJ family two-component response regulator